MKDRMTRRERIKKAEGTGCWAICRVPPKKAVLVGGAAMCLPQNRLFENCGPFLGKARCSWVLKNATSMQCVMRTVVRPACVGPVTCLKACWSPFSVHFLPFFSGSPIWTLFSKVQQGCWEQSSLGLGFSPSRHRPLHSKTWCGL